MGEDGADLYRSLSEMSNKKLDGRKFEGIKSITEMFNEKKDFLI